MAKEPRNYNRVKCVRKKSTLQDKSIRQRTNKRPLRNSTNANKLYSEGGRLFHFTRETHEELLEILNIVDVNLLSNDSTFQSKLIEYLKKTTIYCAKYIDEIFKNPEYKEDLKYYTCASRDRIKKVYKLVTEYRDEKDYDEFSRHVFKINLKRLLTSQSQLSNTEIGNMRDNYAKAQIQQYNSDLDRQIRNREQRREQIREQKKEEEKEEERIEEKPETITEFLKDKPTILTSSKVLTNLDDDELKAITTIYSNDSYRIDYLIRYLNNNNTIENINTIILVNFNLNDVTVLLNVKNIKKVETLVLKHQVRVVGKIKCIDISAIISLLKVIKETTILTHFEFSNFYIDLGDSDNTSIS